MYKNYSKSKLIELIKTKNIIIQIIKKYLRDTEVDEAMERALIKILEEKWKEVNTIFIKIFPKYSYKIEVIYEKENNILNQFKQDIISLIIKYKKLFRKRSEDMIKNIIENKELFDIKNRKGLENTIKWFNKRYSSERSTKNILYKLLFLEEYKELIDKYYES